MTDQKEIVILTSENAGELEERIRKLLEGKQLRVDSELDGSELTHLYGDSQIGNVTIYRDGPVHVTIWVRTVKRHQGYTTNESRTAAFGFGADYVEVDATTPSGTTLYHRYTVLADL